MAFLAEAGAEKDNEQQTKTRWALEYYAGKLPGGSQSLAKWQALGVTRANGKPFRQGADKATLIRQLGKVGDQDYFERGIELAIEQNRMLVEPVNISDFYAVEVDFAEDLERANLFV